VGYQSTNIYHIWIPQDEEVRPEKDVIFNENTFFDLKELKKSTPEVITTMEIPMLSTEPPGGLILEDFEDTWVMNPQATTTNIREQGNQLLPDDTTPLSTSASKTTQSSHTIPIWLTPRTTRSPQTPLHAESQGLPVVDSFALEPSREI